MDRWIPGSGLKAEMAMMSNGYKYGFCDYSSREPLVFTGPEQLGTI